MQLTLDRLLNDFDGVLLAFIGLGLVVALVEMVYELATGRMTWIRIREMLASASVQIPSTLLEKATGALMLWGFYGVYTRLPWHIEAGWGSLAVAVLLVDFVHYWTHRWEHEVRLMWTWHSVHHSSPIYNYSVSLRVVFFRAVPDALYYLPLVLLGFHPLVVVAALSLIALYQIWLHTELVGRLGPLEWVLNTPSHHRVHHASDPEYLDRNYGGLLIIWDRLFGTFAEQRSPPTYGLTTPIESVNPIVVHFHEVVALIRDLRTARSGSEVVGYLFGPPGWRPGSDLR